MPTVFFVLTKEYSSAERGFWKVLYFTVTFQLEQADFIPVPYT